MDDAYTKNDLRSILEIVKDSVDDLSKWSVYNDDKYNEEVHQLNEIIKNIKLKENN